MSEKHIGKVIQVIGPVLDIRFPEGELPALLNAIEIDNQWRKTDRAEVAQQIGDHVGSLHCHEIDRWSGSWNCRGGYGKTDYGSCRRSLSGQGV